MVLVELGLPTGLEVHQLLCGRDVAVPGSAQDPQLNRIFGFAAQMANYVYVIVDRSTGTATAIDPAWDIPGIFQYAADILKARVTAAHFTHRHYDHTGGKVPARMTGGNEVILQGIREVLQQGCLCTGVGSDDVDAVLEQSGVEQASVQALQDAQVLQIGELSQEVARLQVMHTPGHTPGSVCFLLSAGDANASPVVVFTGDTLFIGSSGRVDLPESNPQHLMVSLAKLSKLPNDVVVLPGHNYARPTSSTIGLEKDFNMMMQSAISQSQLTPNPVAAMMPLPDYLKAAKALLEQHDHVEAEDDPCHSLCCGNQPIPHFQHVHYNSKC